MPALNKKDLDAKVDDIFEQVVAWRRHIHQHPELSFQENETTAFIERELRKLDPKGKHVTITKPPTTGLWADLKGTKGNSNKIILLRADIDALAVNETQELPFKSKTEGVSHACGHDGHAAMLLGAVKLLLAEVEKIDGTVRFLFQPAEESLPGGMKDMLKAGCHEGVTMAFAEHILPLPNAPTGSVLMRKGPMFTSADMVSIKVIGKGGHASMPELAVDPVVIAGSIVTGIQNTITRRLPSNAAPVITIATIHSSATAFNAIGDEVEMRGSVRCCDPDVREKVIVYLEELVAGITASAGASYEYEYHKGYSMCINHDEAFAVADNAAKAIVEADKDIVYLPYAMKPSDDFAFLAEKVPSNYAGIGSYNESNGCTVANHNCMFKVDEECFKTGIKLHYSIIHGTLMSS